MYSANSGLMRPLALRGPPPTSPACQPNVFVSVSALVLKHSHSPYAWPQVLVAIISIVLSSLLIVIGLFCSLLFLEIDLLTHEPIATLHGRTTMHYLVLQILLILLPNFFPTNPSPIIPILFFTFAAHLSYSTVRLLPYMFRLTNYIKSSMLFILTYSLFIGIFAAGGFNQPSLMIALYAGYPISAVCGLIVVHVRCIMLDATAQKSLANLPPEMHHSVSAVAVSEVASSAAGSNEQKSSRWSTARRVVQTGALQADAPLELRFSVMNKVHRYMREHAESEFYSPEDALAAVKVMLWKKERASVPKIKQLLRASMLQHGENDWTAIFSICFVRSHFCRFFIRFHSCRRFRFIASKKTWTESLVSLKAQST